MMARLSALSLATMMALSGCGGSSNNDTTTITPSAPPPPGANVPPLPPPPPHNYDLKEGTTYSYIAAVSEEQEKRGQAAGDVLMFKYLGKSDGMNVVASVDDAGRMFGRSRCAEPCVIIKRDGMRSIAFNTSSVIGAVFEDAMHGYLEVAPEGRKASLEDEKISEIPKSFRGEWGAETADCGNDLSDSRMFVTARKVQFYESDAELKSIEQTNSRAVKLQTSNTGEGQAWVSSMQLVLSRSGDDLTVSSDGSAFTWHRCTVG